MTAAAPARPSESALLPGLREALKWKPRTPQLENAMTYAWESALRSFVSALEKQEAAAPAQAEPSPVQAELNAIHALAMNPQDTAPREGDAFTVALLRQLLSRLPASAILAPGAAEREARLRLVAAILKYVGDEVGGEIGTDVEVMDPARVLREAEAAVHGQGATR